MGRREGGREEQGQAWGFVFFSPTATPRLGSCPGPGSGGATQCPQGHPTSSTRNGAGQGLLGLAVGAPGEVVQGKGEGAMG